MTRLMTTAPIIIAAALLSASTFGCRIQGSDGPGARGAAPFQPIHLAAGAHPTMPIAADVNNDGSPDIVFANDGSDSVSVYLGDGKGKFAQAVGSPFPAGQEPNDLATGDFNGDGSLDIAVANHGV